MIEAICSTPLMGVALTCAAWCVGLRVQKWVNSPLVNPMVVAVALILAAILGLGLPYEGYKEGGALISMLLGPVTAVLALNIYRQRKLLGEYFLPVVVGCLVGSLTSLGSVLLLCKLMAVNSAVTASLLPKSVTTAIAVAISDSAGGIRSIAAAAVIVAGTVGAIFVPLFAKVFRVTDPVAEGVAIGACSHALGTTTALRIGPLQGAMSSIALCVCGILTSLLTLFF